MTLPHGANSPATTLVVPMQHEQSQKSNRTIQEKSLDCPDPATLIISDLLDMAMCHQETTGFVAEFYSEETDDWKVRYPLLAS